MKIKQLILTALLIVVALYVNAQINNEKSFKIGAGVMVGLPFSDVSSYTNLAYGFDVLGEYAVAPLFGLTLSAGYVDFIKKSGYAGFKTGLIPILFGGKYYFSDMLYGSAQVGLSLSTQSEAGSAFTFAPGIGYKISKNIDLLIKYQSASSDGGTSAFLGVRAGLSF
jgi:hypothetical protein